MTMADQTDLHELEADMTRVMQRLFDYLGDVVNKAVEIDARSKRLEDSVAQLERRVASLQKNRGARVTFANPEVQSPQKPTAPQSNIRALDDDLVSALKARRPEIPSLLNKPMDSSKLPTEPRRAPMRPPSFLPATPPRKHATKVGHDQAGKRIKKASLDSSSPPSKAPDHGIPAESHYVGVERQSTSSSTRSDPFLNPLSSPAPARGSLSQLSPVGRYAPCPRSRSTRRLGSPLKFSAFASVAEGQEDKDDEFKDDGDLPMVDVSARPSTEDSDHDAEKMDEESNN
ncbi:hypothetical protein F5B22DRAFT_502733 [Xylaria bambusicola]|uniref:uncharacterized protein n=1 Tax=Xylaria bambusicola TaxID=326684 RepID=UPI002007FE32|nr:uncharacterized protein F5B22DRAFT_502733 [Xylaria bambusicola]KAI0521794.1 hypothetical protein F5B22DRAFT_502733 [Xylaria bambusicola]